jgi:hypothetical protein
MILPSTPRSPKLCIPFRFSYRNSVYIFSLSHVCYILLHHIFLDFIGLIIFGEKYKLWRFSNYIVFIRPAVASRFCPHTLFSNTLSTFSSLLLLVLLRMLIRRILFWSVITFCLELFPIISDDTQTSELFYSPRILKLCVFYLYRGQSCGNDAGGGGGDGYDRDSMW